MLKKLQRGFIRIFKFVWRTSRPPLQLEGKWEVVHCRDEQGQYYKYAVRWSVPDDRGRYLWVRHYVYNPLEVIDPENSFYRLAADKDAEYLTKVGCVPADYERRDPQ